MKNMLKLKIISILLVLTPFNFIYSGICSGGCKCCKNNTGNNGGSKTNSKSSKGYTEKPVEKTEDKVEPTEKTDGKGKLGNPDKKDNPAEKKGRPTTTEHKPKEVDGDKKEKEEKKKNEEEEKKKLEEKKKKEEEELNNKIANIKSKVESYLNYRTDTNRDGIETLWECGYNKSNNKFLIIYKIDDEVRFLAEIVDDVNTANTRLAEAININIKEIKTVKGWTKNTKYNLNNSKYTLKQLIDSLNALPKDCRFKKDEFLKVNETTQTGLDSFGRAYINLRNGIIYKSYKTIVGYLYDQPVLERKKADSKTDNRLCFNKGYYIWEYTYEKSNYIKKTKTLALKKATDKSIEYYENTMNTSLLEDNDISNLKFTIIEA